MTNTKYVRVLSVGTGPGQVTPDTTDRGGEHWELPGGGGGGVGTVTSVSVVSANGFAGSVANPTTTPAITLSTTANGLLKGNGTAISAATSEVDYTALAFKTLSVAGQSDIVADSAADTLTIASGTGITLTTNATTDTLTITNSDLGSSQNIFKNFAVAGQSDVVADSNNDTLTLVGSGITITTNATTDTITFTASAGTGDVVGPGSATDNAATRFDGTTGKLIQDSVLLISDLTSGHVNLYTVDATTPTQIQILPGNASSGNNAGARVGILGGTGSGTAAGGAIDFAGGTGGGTNGTGGNADFGAGDGGATQGNGGNTTLFGGQASGDGTGGNVDIFSGGTINGVAGDVSIYGGNSGNVDAGSVYIYGGDSTSGTDGHVVLGNPGKVGIQKIGSTLEALLDAGSIASTNKTFTFPNTTGTFVVSASDGVLATVMTSIQNVLAASATLLAGYSSYVVDFFEIGDGLTFEISDTAMLEIG